MTIHNRYDYVKPLNLDPNYSGFGFAHNFTRTFNVDSFHLVHIVESPYLRSEIRFYFDYLVRENGTYVVAFLLPFKIYTQLTSELNFTVTEIGSIVWAKVKHDQILEGSVNSGRVEGHFKLDHTFIQGKRGQYVAVLPYWVNLRGQAFHDVTEDFGLHSTSFQCRIKIDYLTKLDYALMDSTPDFTITPRYSTWYYGKPLMGVSWEFKSEPQTIVVRFESPSEIEAYSQMLHWSGLLEGVGLPIMIHFGYGMIRDFIEGTKIREKKPVKNSTIQKEITEYSNKKDKDKSI